MLGTTDNEGADALKMSISTILGIPVDYYVLINLQGFSPDGRRPRRHHGQHQPAASRSAETSTPNIPPTSYIAPGSQPASRRLPRAVVRPRSVEHRRLPPDGESALCHRRRHQPGEPGEHPAALPGHRRGGQEDRPHRHPAAVCCRRSSTWASRSRTPRSAASCSSRAPSSTRPPRTSPTCSRSSQKALNPHAVGHPPAEDDPEAQERLRLQPRRPTPADLATDRSAVDAEREGGLEVVLGVGAERDVGRAVAARPGPCRAGRR